MAVEFELSFSKKKIGINLNKVLFWLAILAIFSFFIFLVINGTIGLETVVALVINLSFWALVLLMVFYPKKSNTRFGKLFNRFKAGKLTLKRLIIISLVGALVVVFATLFL